MFFFLLFGLMQCAVHTVKIMTLPGCIQTGNILTCNIFPRDIPDKVTNVYLQDVSELCNIAKGDFDGNNWKQIKHLHISVTPGCETCDQKIGAYALVNLINLEELEILSRSFTGLENNSFSGLKNLKTLTFTGCIKLRVQTVTKALDGQLPNLEILSMTYIDYNGFDIDHDFFSALSLKPIKQINMLHLAIDYANLGYITGLLNTLEIFNISGSTIIEINATGTESKTFKHLKHLDASYTVLPKNMLGFLKYLPKIVGHFYELHFEQETMMSHIKSIDLTGINNQQIPSNLDNVTVYLTGTANKTWEIEHVILRHNQLGYLDITVPCYTSPFKIIDLSFNSIDFLQPKLCKCCTNLTHLNLENNLFFKMARNNYSIFEHLTMFYTNLENLNLAKNQLVKIPKEMFLANKRLKTINLSKNLLQQVTFLLEDLNNIEDLDLTNNQISILDQTSLKYLQEFKDSRQEVGNYTDIIKLDFNPISCSMCPSLDSITWLSQSKLVKRKNLLCTNVNGRGILIDENAVKSVITLCNKAIYTRNIILISVLTPVSAIIAIVTLFCSIKRWRNKRRYKQKMEERLHLIQENEMDMEYVVFLSFSSYDNDFVMDNVYKPLKMHLQELTNTDRELVCIGDMHFQLGRPINDEMVHSLTESAVVLILLSQNFCSSEYCRMEFDFAIQLNKPIVLIVKEDVDPNEMVPSMREIFNTRTRILYERLDGEYRLKTTWENVCTSILELV